MSTDIMDLRQGCLTVVVNAIKNIFFYGIATFWVRFIGGYFWWIGVVLFAILALMIAVNIWMFVMSSLSFLLHGPRVPSNVSRQSMLPQVTIFI